MSKLPKSDCEKIHIDCSNLHALSHGLEELGAGLDGLGSLLELMRLVIDRAESKTMSHTGIINEAAIDTASLESALKVSTELGSEDCISLGAVEHDMSVSRSLVSMSRSKERRMRTDSNTNRATSQQVKHRVCTIAETSGADPFGSSLLSGFEGLLSYLNGVLEGILSEPSGEFGEINREFWVHGTILELINGDDAHSLVSDGVAECV